MPKVSATLPVEAWGSVLIISYSNSLMMDWQVWISWMCEIKQNNFTAGW